MIRSESVYNALVKEMKGNKSVHKHKDSKVNMIGNQLKMQRSILSLSENLTAF